MRKLITLIFIVLSSITHSFGQANSDPDPTQSILPPSPTAAAFAKYVDHPVNHHTGTPSISIPLCELSGRGVSVPVSLSYHAGGVKVDEVASNVGLGWSLNAGGVVTRTVMGKADEGPNGFLQKGASVPYPTVTTTTLQEFATGNWDAQPDVFNFNFGGYSGKFVFDASGNRRIIPHQDLKIDYTLCTGCAYPLNGQIISIIITTPDGVKYTFGTTAAIEYSKTTSNGCKIRNYDDPIITAWYLKTIFNPRTDDQITFNYATNQVTYDLNYSETYQYPASTGQPSGCGGASSQKCITVKTDYGVYLTSISSSSGQINFTSNNNRSDVNTISGNSRITEVQLFQSGQVKLFTLVHSFVTSSGTLPPNASTLDNVRMYLDAVNLYGAGNEFINSHTFTYKNRTALPPRLSYQQDHWGYHNNNTANQLTPAPDSTLATLNYIRQHFASFAPAKRAPHATNAQNGILEKITYPTGGFVQYQYEGNELAVCSNQSSVQTLTATAANEYPGFPEAVYQYFTLDYSQPVTITYDILKIGHRQNGAFVKLKNSSGGQIFEMGGAANIVNPIILQGSTILTLAAGTYTLESQVFRGPDPLAPPPFNTENEFASITATYQKNVSNYVTNIPTGGLRIKQITVDDGDATTSNNIIKAYKYHRDSVACTNGSSAIYFGKPLKYLTNEASIIPGTGTCGTQQCDFLRLSSASMRNLTGYSGNIVAYEEAWELDGLNGENGKKYYKFNIVLDGDPQMGPNPDNVFINTPQIDNAYKSGKPLKERVLNADNQVIWEKLYQYNLSETVNKTSVKAMYTQRRYTLPCAPAPSNTIEYAVEWYDVVSQWVYLTQEKERTFTPGTANYVEKITDYQYDVPSGRHTMPVAVTTTNSDDIQYVQRSKYPKEYTTTTLNDWAAYAIKDLVDANIIHEPIETVQLVKANSSSPEQAVRGRIVKFHTFGSQRIKPREIWLLGTTTPIGSFPFSSINGSGLFTFSGNYYHYSTSDTYDMQGNLQTYARKDDQVSSLIWGHSGLLPTAAVKNATPPEIAYTSFEEESQAASANGGWTLTGTTGGWNSAVGFAQTGLKGFNLSTQRFVEKTGLSGSYLVGFWYKGGKVTILKGSTPEVESPTSTGWAWFEFKVVMAGETLKLAGNASTVYIDEARVHPIDALMSTYSYDAARKLLISIADPSGIPMTYEYDHVQRLKTVFDVNRHVQQALEYQYKIGGAALNSVKTHDVLISGVANHAAAIALLDADVRPVFAYLDGLGRPIQTVAVKESAGTNDMVNYQTYDEFGRGRYQYLPHTVTSNNGAYRSNASGSQAAFYIALFGSTDGVYSFQQTEFEASPLNRIKRQRAQGSLYYNKPIVNNYYANDANEVRNFKTSGFYGVNTLIKTQVTDEHNKLTTTYTDKLGRKVMTNQDGSRTYYLYDDFGNLQSVIQPLGSALGHNNSMLLWTDASLNNLSFKYTYDDRQRLSTKTVPGAGTTTLYYDRLDRLVMSADANGVKLFTKYDILGRPVLTGRYFGPLTPSASNGLYESITNGNSPLYYTQTQSFPTSSSLARIFSITYYDGYDWDASNTVDATEQYSTPPSVSAPYQTYVQPYSWVRGKATCVKTALLPPGASDIINYYYKTASYYDIKGRVVQVKADNHLGGTEVSNTAYTFAGWVKNTHRVHTATPPGGVATTLTIQERFEHDHAGRILRAFHKVDAGTEIQISESTYSELDLLSTKKLHKKNSSFVQTIDYTYNIRNWMTRINDPASLGADAWGMELVYGPGDGLLSLAYQSGQNANYNGNITMMKWRTQGQTITPTYGFLYDGLNRLTSALYAEKGTSSYSNYNRYNEAQSYDANGNILSLTRSGLASGSAGSIDNLVYTYASNSNRIVDIAENESNVSFRDKGFKYYNTGSGDFTYDAAGNLTTEPSKGAVIIYNHLNMPRLFTLGSNTIEIEYDGGGNKLRKTVKQGSTTLYIQNYLGGIEYNSARLEAVFHAEGRVYNTNVGTGSSTLALRYEYAIRDHLGNTRILFTDKNDNGVLNVTAGTDNEIIQENQYYPFGMNQEGAFMNDAAAKDTKYQYNGKELNDDFGLNWSDYGARWYDAAIGRFGSTDRFAEKYSLMTPYQYAANNPIKFIEMNGDSVKTFFYNQEGTQVNDVPEVVQQMFNSEYGISVAYNAKTNMLYQSGKVETKNTTSTPGIALIEGILGEKNSDVALAFGYNLGEDDGKSRSAIGFGRHSGKPKAGIAVLDLGDFNENGTIKYHERNDKFHERSLNLARTFEHEFFGHGVQGFPGGRWGEEKVSDYINKQFALPAGIPGRKGYTDSFSNFGQIFPIRKYANALERINKIINTAPYQ
ncbi:MAG TPA: DUF6443 domain-containing protein [Haliscomenobacter sp.]|uniref:DUF6443 domain-containing protein n=1 Tax=Haliscomenobacter sp. TaxID=2717303 RepID=UPI002C30E1BE|nr:DUF6443 domain-containing protein [Haliscomenobacter sp.]HOY19142.1 DUF6443 domain-containing protein [Haliscomenobacter sp.]